MSKPKNYQFPREAEVSITHKKGLCQETCRLTALAEQGSLQPEAPQGFPQAVLQALVSTLFLQELSI